MDSFRLNKDLMSVFIWEFYYFIFYRRTISRSCSFNRTGKQRRSVQIFPNDFVRRFVCICKPAWHLIDLNVFRICRKRKRHDSFITFLFFHLCKIDWVFINSCRSSRFRSIHLNSKWFQTVGKIICALQPVRTCLRTYFSVNAAGF